MAAVRNLLSSSFSVASLASPLQSCSITQISSSEAPVASFIISSTFLGSTLLDCLEAMLSAGSVTA